MSGGETIARMLAAEGVEKVFGIIDGTYFGFYSNLRKYGIDLITPRHETSAVHMAGAYARLTGKLGVCMASNGPGAANALPGVAVENGEGNRVLLLTSSRRTGIAYPDRGGTYQYFDQVAVMKPMTKWSGSAQAPARIPELMRRALRKCRQGRPGVVHLDVPENLMNAKDMAPEFLEPHEYRRVAEIVPPEDQVERAAEILVGCRRPLIHAGSGVVHAQAFAELEKVAEILRAPVTTSWAARGVLPETSDLSVPMIYVDLYTEVRNEADAVLVLGSRLGETDLWGKPPYWRKAAEQRTIQVDVDDDYLGCNKRTELAILSDARAFLDRLYGRLVEKKARIATEERGAYLTSLKEKSLRKRRELDEALKDAASPMHPAHVGKVCRDVLEDDAVMVFDGGNTVIWGNFYYELRAPNCQVATHKFGMLGAGVAQALGACVARPGKQVVCVIGDGAMGFHPQEIETAVRNDLRPVYVVLCDRQWGMVKMNQQFALKPVKTMLMKSLGPDETINADLGEIRFDRLAESMGAHGERVSRPQDLRPALERALGAGRCAVLHVDVDPVKHMWAPGLMHFKKMHLEPKGK